MKLYLIGYMASGKTRVGEELARLSGFSFLDLDALFESRYRISVFDFFSRYGEPLFRQLERDILQETGELDQVIISTGGGTPCFYSNISFIKASGVSVYLRMPTGLLVQRIADTRKKRPLIQAVSSRQLPDFVSRQIKEREVFYLQADHVVDGPAYPLQKIIALMP